MTRSVNIAEAKAHLSALVDRAAAGEEIILSRAGRPVPRLMPLEEQTPRQPGLLKHWQIPDDLFLEP
jgi:prevent-host-death family protein